MGLSQPSALPLAGGTEQAAPAFYEETFPFLSE